MNHQQRTTRTCKWFTQFPSSSKSQEPRPVPDQRKEIRRKIKYLHSGNWIKEWRWLICNNNTKVQLYKNVRGGEEALRYDPFCSPHFTHDIILVMSPWSSFLVHWLTPVVRLRGGRVCWTVSGVCFDSRFISCAQDTHNFSIPRTRVVCRCAIVEWGSTNRAMINRWRAFTTCRADDTST